MRKRLPISELKRTTLIRLEPKVLARLRATARRRGVSQSEIVRLCLNRALPAVERQLRKMT